MASAMNNTLTGPDITARYTRAIEVYGHTGDEDTLFEAYEIARHGLADNMTVADLGTLHHRAVRRLLRGHDDLNVALQRAEDFFIEGVSVFDMAITGFQTNVGKLKHEIQERKEIEEELRSVTFELAHQRDKLDCKVKQRTADLRSRAKELEQSNRQLLSTNKELADFTYALSHDLKTPTNTIESVLRLLSEDHARAMEADALELIGIASSIADRMKRQLDDIQLYSGLVDHRFEPEPVDLEQVYQRIVKDLDREIAEAEACLSCTALPAVQGSRFQLEILLRNLISNALKYRLAGRKPDIRIVATTAPEEDKVSLSVRDNGIGIARERHDQIFKLFKRLHRYDEYKGTGIGLALCKRVAENHGTTIEVSSTEGVGSTFSLTLPRAEVAL